MFWCRMLLVVESALGKGHILVFQYQERKYLHRLSQNSPCHQRAEMISCMWSFVLKLWTHQQSLTVQRLWIVTSSTCWPDKTSLHLIPIITRDQRWSYSTSSYPVSFKNAAHNFMGSDMHPNANKTTLWMKRFTGTETRERLACYVTTAVPCQFI